MTNAQASSPCATSPCIGICTLDETSAFCLGCGRSLDDIANWSRYSERQRTEIMLSLQGSLPVEQD
ncbi:DUF1289 domain-containing protein [Agrobacterium vitis]|uniref:DUF1289 domain-containing protein n=1 Tax=Agrobacterium vitis TaxID=373 RepID=UPI003D2CA33E